MHTIQLVIANPGHIPLADLARPKLTIVVSGEAMATPTAEAAAQGAETVEIVMLDIFFEPVAVTIPADTGVTLTLANEGVTLHNFSIDALDVSVDVDPGASKEVVIDAPAGTYEFYCNVPGHKAAGMVGTLTVE